MKLQNHAWAIFLAIVVTIVYVFPHIYFAHSLGSSYKGIYMSRSYDEDTYDSAIRQVYDGLSPTDNPYMPEYKEKTIVSMYKMPELVVGTIGKVFHMSIGTLSIVSKFVFPPIIFLAIYGFVFVLTRNKWASCLAALFVVVGHELAPLDIHSAIQTVRFNSPFKSFLFYNRPVNPQISAIFFFLSLFSITRLWQHPESKKAVASTAILIGILSYMYFYFWNFSLIFIAVLCVYAIYNRNKALIKGTFWSIVGSLVVSIPFIVAAVGALQSGGGAIGKNYLLTHRIIIEKVSLLPIVFFTLVYLWNYVIRSYRGGSMRIWTWLEDPKYYFLFCLAVATCIASNQQVIHGFEIQQQHYHFMTNIPVFIVIVSVLVVEFLFRYGARFAKPVIAIVSLIVLVHGIGIQVSSYRFWKPVFAEYQKYAPSFQWLDEHTKTNDVVYANEVLSEIIPVYTHDAVYGSLHASVYPVPTQRLEHNYFIFMYISGVQEKDARKYLYDHRDEFGQYVYEGQYWRSVCGSFGCFPDSVVDAAVQEYVVFRKESFANDISKYRVDYLLWDKKTDPTWQIVRTYFTKEVFSSGDVTLLHHEQ